MRYTRGERLAMPKDGASAATANIKLHSTRDGAMVTDAAANGPLQVAAFRPGSRAICRCMAEEGCKPEDCDALYIADSAGNHVATFHGPQYRATDETNHDAGMRGLCVYRLPKTTTTKDEDRLVQLRDALVRLNKQNADFWAARNAVEE